MTKKTGGEGTTGNGDEQQGPAAQVRLFFIFSFIFFYFN